VLLDTREATAFATGHLIGSVNVGLEGRYAQYVGSVVRPDEEIVLLAEPGTELEAKVRIVAESEHWVAYVPFAARWPVEVHLAPRRDVPDLPALSGAERDDLAKVYLDLLQRLDRYYVAKDGTPIRLPYIAGWHQAPSGAGREVSRLHLQVMSVLRSPKKLKYLAGSESGVGGWVNDVPPEQIAERLRDVAL
jgi:UDPglucose--hexose-1-phosphate uridylyltransferase